MLLFFDDLLLYNIPNTLNGVSISPTL